MDATTMQLSEEEPMVYSDDDPRGVLELARYAVPVARRQVATLAAVARPAGEAAAFLLVEVLRRPRARAAAVELARSLARRVAASHLLPSASVGVPATTWRVTVVEECVVAGADVLVRRVETALVPPYHEPTPPGQSAEICIRPDQGTVVVGQLPYGRER
jgi:hypothetical protein